MVIILKIYLASPFFNDEELENVKKAEEILTKRGFDVFSPRLNEVRTVDTKNKPLWSKETFMNDRRFIDWADVMVMLYYGAYSDSGTAWECGYAFGTNTPVVVVHLQLRSRTPSASGQAGRGELMLIFSFVFIFFKPILLSPVLLILLLISREMTPHHHHH